MPQCFDVNNVPQDCGAASDSGGSSCFDDTAQEVSCSEVGGYASALDTALVPVVSTSGPAAANASATGAIGASRTGGGAVAAPGPSLFSQISALIPVGANAYAATQQPPKNTITVGKSGVAIPTSAGSLLLVGALVVAGIFLYTASKKRA